jgi:hypothetical protein
MEREVFEVFVLPDGESFYAWNVKFEVAERRRESRPCSYHEKDGSVRKGVVHYILELADVTFSASPGSIRVGLQGQLTSPNDIFFDVTVSEFRPVGEHIVVQGKASRMCDYEKDR